VAELPETLIRYLAERNTQRAENVDAVVAALTERERRLVREAAVMAYVQGLMRDRAEGCPNDAVVLGLVVDACLAAPDLYPVISGVLPCSECAHPQYAHKDGEDPVSPGACLACDAEDSDDAHHDYVPVPHDSGQDTDGRETQR
jgi:hypothetical protein